MKLKTLLLAAFACNCLLLVVTPAEAQPSPTPDDLAKDPVLFLKTARKALKWDVPTEPVKLIGPIYFVGTKGLSSFLITGSEGHVLIYTGMPGSGEMIEKSIAKLGFKPKDVKIILTGHAHCDHAGGHAYLKNTTGAKIAMMREEVELFESGGKLDFHYGDYKEFAFDPAKVDTIFRDEDEIKLGDITLKALLTPGHTQGSTTYTTKIVADGKTYTVVFPDGTSVNPGYRVSKNPSYKGIADNYRRTFRTLDALKPDVWLNCHTEFFGYETKLANSAKEGVAAWVDPDGYKKYIAAAKAKFETTVKREKAAPKGDGKPVPVTVENFARAETDMYFGRRVEEKGVGKLGGPREFTPLDKQIVVRMNRDTLYTDGVFDLDAAPVSITLPDAGKRYMALQVVNQDHYTVEVVYPPGRHTYTKEKVGSRYMFAIVRTLADPDDPADVKAANALRDAIKVEQAKAGTWEAPNWDDKSRTEIRDALAVLGKHQGEGTGNMFGTRAEVDPIRHMIGTAIGWGGNPTAAAVYSSFYPPQNDGKTAYTLTVKDVPVDGFWSITVYNAKGYMEENDLGRYSLNNLTAKPNADGSFAIHFGGDKTAANHLPIPPGWNYTVRLYRPRKEVIKGTWKFPEAKPTI
jgi:para-nitrobenzyl esterase